MFKLEEVTSLNEKNHLKETLEVSFKTFLLTLTVTLRHTLKLQRQTSTRPQTLREEEHERNRNRIMEIHNFKDINTNDLQDLVTKDVVEDDDYMDGDQA